MNENRNALELLKIEIAAREETIKKRRELLKDLNFNLDCYCTQSATICKLAAKTIKSGDHASVAKIVTEPDLTSAEIISQYI